MSNFEMEAKDLEKLYDPALWSPFFSSVVIRDEFDQKAIAASKKAQQTIPNEEIQYGPTGKQKINIFGASLLPADAPIFLYIHGGYWMRGCREDSCFMVEPLFNAGFICCVVGYELVPKVSLPEIVSEIKEAVKAVIDLADSLGSKGIYICGHSAGAHLAAMLLSSDFFHENNKDFIRGIILIAGLYDLEPLNHLALGKELGLTEDIVTSCSPVKLKITTKNRVKVLVVAAKFDSPEFIRQSYSFYQILLANGIKTQYTLTNEDHFTAAVKLAQEDYEIIKAIIHMAR